MAATPSRPRSVPRAVHLVLLGSALGGVLASCGYDPGTADMQWSLSEKSEQELRAGGSWGRKAQIDGALTTLFGTPQAPRYLETEDMVDNGDSPNFAFLELDEAGQDALVRDNAERRFRFQLELIAAARYAEVPEPLHAPDLWRTWSEDFAPLHTGVAEEGEDGKSILVKVDPSSACDVWVDGADDDASWHDKAVALFTNWYPTLRESAETYRAQCLHCHGVEGGGDGPTADYLDPRPRDYRLGKFKWVAVGYGLVPRRADLLHVLEQGAVGTAMPSFRRFSRGELEGLVDYVRLLSMRGMVESRLVPELVDAGDLSLESIQEAYADVWSTWQGAEQVAADVDVPRWDHMDAEAFAAREEHGRELFMGTVANCFSCHGPEGYGVDSYVPPVSLLDTDGNVKPDDWGNPSAPRNFTRAIFRGGNRPIDLYRRVKYGIGGTIMPAADASLTDDDIWDLVLYVKKLSNDNDVARRTEMIEARLEQERHAAHHAGGEHADDHTDEHDGGDDHAEEGAGH